MSTIAIFGATGYTGGNILEEALARGHHVIAIARDVSGLEPRDRVEVRAGSLHDAALVADMADASDVLAVALPARAIDGLSLRDALPSLVAASRDQHVRLGIVGGAGSSLESDGGPRLLDDPSFPKAYKPEAQAAAAVLDALRDADGADWFVVSPAQEYGSYAPGSRNGSYRTGGDVVVRDAEGRSYISGADFAIAFLDEVENPRHSGARFTVGY
jgi:Putative NADH-flavin reductase